MIDRGKGRVFRLTALISSPQIFFLGFTTEERGTFAKCPSICFLGQNLHQSGQERQGKSKPKLTRIKFSNIVSFLRLLLDPFKKFLGEVSSSWGICPTHLWRFLLKFSDAFLRGSRSELFQARASSNPLRSSSCKQSNVPTWLARLSFSSAT